jgi:hypothetical protein
MKRWILVNYDGRDLHEIQARDEHPKRDKTDDVRAIGICYNQAARGNAKAMAAVLLHEHDAAAILKLREKEFGPQDTWNYGRTPLYRAP